MRYVIEIKPGIYQSKNTLADPTTTDLHDAWPYLTPEDAAHELWQYGTDKDPAGLAVRAVEIKLVRWPEQDIDLESFGEETAAGAYDNTPEEDQDNP